MNNTHNPAVEESLKRQSYLEQYALNNLSFSYISGSRLYGTNNEFSDLDIRGVFIHSALNHFSIVKEDQFTDVIFSGNNDTVLFELSNYASMLREQKTNVLESIWIKDKDIQEDSPLFKTLRDNRLEFRNNSALDKMLGFAASQFKLAKKFDAKHYDKSMPEPLRKDFLKVISSNNKDIPITNVCATKTAQNPNIFNLYSSEYLDNKEHSWIVDNNFLFVKNNHLLDKPVLAVVEFQSEEFKIEYLKYKNFLNWLENGNMNKLNASKEIGYQTKPMMHAFRNLYMSLDYLNTSEIVLFRPEKDFLLSVRNGKFSLNECEELYTQLNEEIKAKKINFSVPEFNDSLLNEILKDSYFSHFGLKPNKTLKYKL